MTGGCGSVVMCSDGSIPGVQGGVPVRPPRPAQPRPRGAGLPLHVRQLRRASRHLRTRRPGQVNVNSSASNEGYPKVRKDHKGRVVWLAYSVL